MQILYTIGYTKKSLRDFIGLLREAGVDCVVDIRLNNTSQLAAFSKKDDLCFLLGDGFGIDYIHMVELAPSQDLLDSYKANKDWAVYELSYSSLIEERGMVAELLAAVHDNGWQRPCLLCSEPDACCCHRGLLAEAVQNEVGSLEVRHL